MRLLPVLAVLLAGFAGCLADEPPSPCTRDLQSYQWFFGAGHSLRVDLDAANQGSGVEPGNGFSNAFLTNDLNEWRSDNLPEGLHATGNVTIDYWVRNNGQPAPVMIGGDPGEGYHFFNQFGSNKAFQPAYAIEYDSAFPAPGDVAHYTETLALPAGGWVFEEGDQVRLLLTSLVLDGGHDILYGFDHPSSVVFEATCYEARTWTMLDSAEHAISLTGNQGLLTGAVPEDEANSATHAVDLLPGTTRLTAILTQTSDPNPVKDDVDFTLTVNGEDVWSGGSPYTDETMVLWEDNLAALPAGEVAIRVDSYSGVAYEGTLTIIQESDDA